MLEVGTTEIDGQIESVHDPQGLSNSDINEIQA
jgi:hypothetical protein